ncbi:DNA damage response protein kinase Dun1p [[Candida] anglica]
MSLSRKRFLQDETPTHKRVSHDFPTIAKLYGVIAEASHISIPRKSGGVVLGRSSACDLRISGTDVSSKHCQFSLACNEAGREFLYVTDMSSNGTFVNDELIGKASTTLLKSGDKLQFAKTGGAYIFRYAVDEVEDRNRKKSFFDDYIMGAPLGSGHYAVVKEARDRHSGDVVAVKIFHPNKGSNNVNTQKQEEETAKLQQEMNLLLSFNHPNIVKFISYYVEPISQHSVTTYLVLEKMNDGELFQRIVNKSKLGQLETKAIFRQLLSGLSYLHDNNIIHRDIKPENILLDITPRTSSEQIQTGPWDEHELDIKVKIADFGLAKFIGELKFTNTLCGTPAYVAPEILDNSNERTYSTKADIWSSGVLLYVCLCGFPPFSEELAPPSMKDQILEGKYAFYSPYWDDISDSALDLISSLLVVEPGQRFDVSQTARHFWFSESENSIEPSSSQISSEAMHVESIATSTSSIERTQLRSNTQPLSLREAYTSELNFQKSSMA